MMTTLMKPSSPDLTQVVNKCILTFDLDNDAAEALLSLSKTQETQTSSNKNNSTSWAENERAALASELGKIVLKDNAWIGPPSETYIGEAKRNWSGTCHLLPRCIFAVSTSGEVSKALKILRLVGSRFAVRSGGHNPNSGWSSTDDRGVLIDLAGLNKIEVAGDRLSIKVGPGAKWSHVYKACQNMGVSVIGARQPDVGVGGLILGGGIPNFSSEYGLVCDNVEEFEVVLADSRIVRASRRENEDLFWALKGGGPNFGIITQAVLRTVPIDKLWFEARLYNPAHNAEILEAVQEYQQEWRYDSKASVMISIGNQRSFVGWVYSEPLQSPQSLEPFYNIPFESHFIEPTFGTLAELSAAMTKVLGPPVTMRRAIMAVSVRPNKELYQKVYQYWTSIAEEIFGLTGFGMNLGVQPITAKAVTIGQDNGGNALNLVPEPQTWFNALVQYTSSEHDKQALDAVNKVAKFVEKTTHKMGLLLDFVFMNDANSSQNPLASYGTEGLSKLREISKKYDPEQIFQTLQNSGFLLRGT